MTENRYPEHEKLKKVQKVSQAIHDFVYFMQSEKGLTFAFWPEKDSSNARMWPWTGDLTAAVAEFLDINQTALEEEKEQMIEELRSAWPE